MTAIAATVGAHTVTVADIDAREQALRAGPRRYALPRAGTAEARQLRRWLTQVLVAERVVAAASAGLDAAAVPTEDELLPDTVARLEIGSVAAATLADPAARAVYVAVTSDVTVTDEAVAAYHARNPLRFSHTQPAGGGWRRPSTAAALGDVRAEIATHLLAAARRRAYRRWLDSRCAEMVTLYEGYEHPGDPRQPDNTHRH
ncbi:DUF7158 domain-containing protein [Mycobacterium sp. ZZG]